MSVLTKKLPKGAKVEAKVNSISMLMKELGHTELDIEGAEYEAFKDQ